MWLVLIPAAWILLGAGALWAWHRFAASVPALDEPVPYWPAAAPCTWCQPVPAGMCTCTSVCGHEKCIGDHTSMAVLTAADMRMLHKWIKEGHE